MTRLTAVLAAAAVIASAGAAHAFSRVSDEVEFNRLMDGKELRLGLMGIALDVNPDGTIVGRASGYDVTGTWSWEDGYFCRVMDWGGTEIPYTCQLVEVNGGQMRFTTDRGAGDDATFNLR